MTAPLLKICVDDNIDPQRFRLIFEAGQRVFSAAANIPRALTPEEDESIRWYLEEYRRFPFEPATTIAKNTSAHLKQLGEQLFDQVFNSTTEGRDVWNAVDEHLETTRIEIAVDPSRFAVPPWELLWNPLDVMPVACRAASFVRAGLTPVALPEPITAGAVRILVIISRPAGILDAPFRSVAARLLNGIEDDPRFLIEILRPPTFDAFMTTIRTAADQGRPFSVVHFDGHGVHEDLNAKRENRPARRQRGYLLFETPLHPDRPDYIDAPTLGEALAAGGHPILILNACRSARTEIVNERVGGRPPLGSLADELLRLSQPAVLAMQYNVEVETASRFVDDLYQGLAQHGSLAEAVRFGRHNLFLSANAKSSDRHVRLHDWLVPVLFETSPRSLFHTPMVPARGFRTNRKLAAVTFGTDDGLMAIERAFQIARVVVLAGPIGSGKTALAAEFTTWDGRTRDKGRASSPLHILDASTKDVVELAASGSRVLIETRDANVSLAPEHAVVRMIPLDFPARIALLRQRLPDSTGFDPDLWQPVLTFSQGNPGVLRHIADMIATFSIADPDAILERARTQPIGLDPTIFADILHGFESDDLDCVAIAALFEGPVSSRMLRMLASVGSTPHADQDADAAFNRLSILGLATPLGSSYYLMHPGLPGLLRPEFDRRYPSARGEMIRAAVVTLFAAVCAVFYKHADSGRRDAYELQFQTLSQIEPSIWRVLDQALAVGSWDSASNLAAALRCILIQQGRRPEWQRLAPRLLKLIADDAHGAPLAGRESLWHLMQEDRIEHLMRIHSLSEAAWLQERMLHQVRYEHANIEGSASDEFAKDILIAQLRRFGDIRKAQCHSDALRHYLEALQIAQRLASTIHEQRIAAQLAVYHLGREAIDWLELSYWETYASDLCPPYDRIGQAKLKVLRGAIALARGQSAEAVECLQVALTGLLPAEASDERAECELKLGRALFEYRKDLSGSMRHIQSALAWYDLDQNVYQASCVRLAASHILSKAGENGRAFFYAKQAARGFASLAPHAERQAQEAYRLATDLENSEPSGEKRA